VKRIEVKNHRGSKDERHVEITLIKVKTVKLNRSEVSVAWG